MHVLFWDIDGTLLSTARAGVFALEEAAREVLGIKPDFSELATSGLTDAEIAKLVIETYGAAADGQPPAELVGPFLRAYERHLPDRLPLRQGRVLPGVSHILDDVRGRPEVTCLLLTGNTRAGARAKLAHYGLDGYFEDGAFCADSDDRTAIARRALEVAEAQTGERADLERTYVIGDTPHDIACGKVIGARTVAVATGVHELAQLEECEPWRLLEELPAPADFARLLELPAAAPLGASD